MFASVDSNTLATLLFLIVGMSLLKGALLSAGFTVAVLRVEKSYFKYTGKGIYFNFYRSH